jgi:hypothetical protein
MQTAPSSSASAQPSSPPQSSNGKLAYPHLQNGHAKHMDGRQSDYQSPGTWSNSGGGGATALLLFFLFHALFWFLLTLYRTAACWLISAGSGPASRELFLCTWPRVRHGAVVSKIWWFPRICASEPIYSRPATSRRNGASNKSVSAFAAYFCQQPSLSSLQQV